MNVAAAAASAGQEGYWAENLSTAAGKVMYKEDATRATATIETASGNGKYEDEQNLFNEDPSEEKREKSSNVCGKEDAGRKERKTSGGGPPSPSPPVDSHHVSISDHEHQHQLTTKGRQTVQLTRRRSSSTGDDVEDEGCRKEELSVAAERLAVGREYSTEEQVERAGEWHKHNNYELETTAGGTSTTEDGRDMSGDTRCFQSGGEHYNHSYQSRSSTPSSSSRNMSPSEITTAGQTWSGNNNPVSSSSAISAPRFSPGGAGCVPPPFVSAPAPVARQPAPPFPFFANPFMVPFAPHLPQANIISQQNSAANGNSSSSPDDWTAASNIAGVRRNPDSGGFYLHPQYYHELLQQYFRNMAMSEASTVAGPEESSGDHTPSAGDERTTTSIKASTGSSSYQEPSSRKGNSDEQQASSSAGSSGTHQQRIVTPGDLDESSRPVSRDTADPAGPQQRDDDDDTSSRRQTPSTEWHQGSQDARDKMDRPGGDSTDNTSNDDVSVDVSADVSPQKAAVRPETLQLDENVENDQSVQIEHGGRPDSENPAMALIKKQISEIEKQILRKAQNQNIRKMDAKEIEAFLLMEQQRTLEANLFESATNTGGCWAPSAFPPWLQNDSIHWEQASAVADAFSHQQRFEPAPDQRSLYELAAAAAAASGGGATDNSAASSSGAEYGGQPAPHSSGLVQAHFPQATSGFVPQPPPAMYSSAVPWPPTAFYHPGFAGASPFFAPPGVYGGSLAASQFVPNAAHQFANVPPATFAAAAVPFHHHSQPHHAAPEDAAATTLRTSHSVQMPDGREAVDGTLSSSATTTRPASSAPSLQHGISAGDDGQCDSGQVEEDEPVWVLRESYVRKLKREEERQAEKERAAAKQAQSEVVDRAVPDSDVYNETDKLLDSQRNDSAVRDEHHDASPNDSEPQTQKKVKKKKEVMVHEPAVLIEGVLFRGRYLGSTQLVCDGRPTKATRMMQAQEAVSRIKAPDGETQPSTDVDLFISTEKIMVLNTDLQRVSDTDVRQDIMMDHPLRTISYIADIGNLVVLMARRMSQSSPDSPEPAISRTPKVICHIFESEEAQFIAQSIGQAFQVAYMEFLRANGIEDPGYLRDVDYQEVLNAQEIFGEELEMFARKETQKDVVVPKQKNEIMGVVIVESGWGSMLPTVVIANLMPGGPAARSNNLNIGDHIIALNGISFVGLPLSACQNHIRNVKHLTAVKLTVVHTPPVVEVRIKRPDTKYQLGFSVQNGVICSLLRGGIAERGGVRVGHRIIEINSQSVVAVPHEKIVTMLATAVGEIQMKTMPTSMFRLLTGQETPNYI